ncbi:MAG: glycosyltransferase [Anaerolineae bacterium]|nr:glycosyltransferase [Anaerolineae bacterium]
MKRLLLVTPNLPYPPQSGSGLRAYGLLRGLKRYAPDFPLEIDLLAYHDDTVQPEATPLPDLCTSITTVSTPSRSKGQRLKSLFTSTQPDIARRLESDEMRAKLTQLMTNHTYDFALYIGIETAILMKQARALQPNCKQIYDAANIEHLLQRRIAMVDRGNIKRLPASIYSQIQVGRIWRFESAICRSADAVTAVSCEDAKTLVQFRSDNKVSVVPNGIFVEDYQKTSETLDLGKNAIIFTGKMDYRPNVDAMLWFCDEVLPRVTSEIADCKLYIVGQKPHSSLTILSDDPHIEITGWVASVTPFLHSAGVYVTPLRMGSGTRLKLLEAMAAGCAIVSTSIGAEGLSAEAVATMRIKDDAAGFAAAITALLRHKAEAEALSENARRVAKEQYDWSAIIPALTVTLRAFSHG